MAHFEASPQNDNSSLASLLKHDNEAFKLAYSLWVTYNNFFHLHQGLGGSRLEAFATHLTTKNGSLILSAKEREFFDQLKRFISRLNVTAKTYKQEALIPKGFAQLQNNIRFSLKETRQKKWIDALVHMFEATILPIFAPERLREHKGVIDRIHSQVDNIFNIDTLSQEAEKTIDEYKALSSGAQNSSERLHQQEALKTQKDYLFWRCVRLVARDYQTSFENANIWLSMHLSGETTEAPIAQRIQESTQKHAPLDSLPAGLLSALQKLRDFDLNPNKGMLLKSRPTLWQGDEPEEHSGANIPPIMKIAEERKHLWEKVQSELFVFWGKDEKDGDYNSAIAFWIKWSKYMDFKKQ